MKRIISFFISILFTIQIFASQVSDTLIWSVISGGKQVGFSKTWKNPDGSLTDWFQFNDRGRGDSTVANYRLDDEGFLEYLDASGVDYYKKPVFEKFWIKKKKAFWENNAEEGQLRLAGKANYIPLNISVGNSYRAYFQADNYTIDLLPSGTSQLTVLTEHELWDGKTVRLISTKGIGFEPNYAWIDEEGLFFAYPSNWFAFIRSGYEDQNDELLEIQNDFQRNYYEQIAQPYRAPGAKQFVVKNAQLFDPVTGVVRPEANIYLDNGVIRDITYNTPDTEEGFDIIDAQGKFVMPGLWDMHVHYGTHVQGLQHLACGVTNVRDMGNGLDLLDTRDHIEASQVLGPRIQVMSGFIDGAGPYAGPTGEQINSIDEGITAIRKYAALGYEQIKLYSSIKPEWVQALTEEAHRYNLRVSGHIPPHMLAEEAIEAGYNEIQHANMLFLNFYGKDLDTRTPLRFTAVAERAAAFDFESDAFYQFVGKLKERNIAVDPTVSIFEGMFTGRKGEYSPTYAPIADRFPLSSQRFLKRGASLEIPAGQEETFRQSFESMLKMVRILFENGITILPGTDAMAGFTLHRELENYSRAGIPNTEILKMATLTSAEVARKSDRFGTIEPGKVADIILIDGNPVDNMSDIRKVETVIKGNEVYQTVDLLEKLSIKYFE